MFVLILNRLLVEAALDILYFPIWWYTRGAGHAVLWCVNLLRNGNSSLGPGIWLRNIFVPMFGQYDWQGRIISFFMRLVNVIGRGFALVLWGFFCTLLFVFWLALPIIMVWSIFTVANN